ncbi:MAG TPA: hypothetical protein VNQ76_13825, partial [Planctomicrobium sp.]|nr:hypothetical protein [Planctomicrobium sp.]
GTELTLPSLRSKGTMTVAWPVAGQKVSTSDNNHLVVTIQRFAQGLGVEYSIHGEPAATRHRTIPIQESGPQDPSPCGMWLTEIGTSHRATPSLLPTSTVHWASESIEIQSETTRSDLLREMERRLTELNRHRTVELILVEWKLEGAGPLLSSLLHDSDLRELLQASRSLAGSQQRLWSWKIETRPSVAQLEHWQRESNVYAQALNVQQELSSTSQNEGLELRELPGHDSAHPPHHGRVHWVKKRLAHSLLRSRHGRPSQE